VTKVAFASTLLVASTFILSKIENPIFTPIEATRQESNGYAFPIEKLKEPHPGKNAVVLVSCGSFNPPTNLHLQLLEGTKDYLEQTQNTDVILGVMSPVHDAYGKKGLLPIHHRLKFVEICTRDSKWIALDDWEAKQDKYSTTVTVLRHIDEYVKRNVVDPRNVRVMLVCGADLLESFNRPGLWATADQEEILSKFGVCVLERGDLKLNELIYGNDIMFKNMVSSFHRSHLFRVTFTLYQISSPTTFLQPKFDNLSKEDTLSNICVQRVSKITSQLTIYSNKSSGVFPSNHRHREKSFISQSKFQPIRFDHFSTQNMPKQIHEIKDFLKKANQKDASAIVIHKNKGARKQKFKLRTKSYLYTLVLRDAEKSTKLRQSLPPSIKVREIGPGRTKSVKKDKKDTKKKTEKK
jgi:nicotinamide mononucleotide adenylyltransferase